MSVTPGADAIAIILARAGSKGLPGKNRAPVAGRPCVAWTFDHVRDARGVTRAGVSTDDPQIAALAMHAGLEHWPRSAGLAGDSATVDAAAREALGLADARGVIRGDAAVVILYANVPVRPAGLIDRALARLRETGCDSVQSYAAVGKHHPMWTARVDGDGRVRPWQGETLFGGIYRRQELEPAFVPDGGVVVVRRSCLDAAAGSDHPHAFLGRDHRGVTTEPGDVVDIDTALDLAVADRLLSR
jgi:N-acylneuraminate cytidylyltransferase